MEKRIIFLITGAVLCVFVILLVLFKGTPQDRVSLDSITEIGESILHHTAKTAKVFSRVSDEDEIIIGSRLHKKHLSGKTVEDPRTDYINEVGKRVAMNVKRKNIPYTFYVTGSIYPNAFATPGGHVYITQGMLDMLRSEAELANILGHEITHVDAKHCIESIQLEMKSQKIKGATIDDMVIIGSRTILRPGYSEVQEEEADLGGTYLASAAGYHPMGSCAAFERIEDLRGSKDRADTSITPIGDTLKAAEGIINRYYSTHPPSPDRIEKVKKYIRENNLMEENKEYYIGQKNYADMEAYPQKQYEEEFKAEYIVSEETPEEK